MQACFKFSLRRISITNAKNFNYEAVRLQGIRLRRILIMNKFADKEIRLYLKLKPLEIFKALVQQQCSLSCKVNSRHKAGYDVK